jgi:AcrR family transcriptional regulator
LQLYFCRDRNYDGDVSPGTDDGKDVGGADEADDGAGAARLEGLRERKKRQMRQLISDTATAMFLQRGFDDVRVTEVAEACGVSEKTVYNYFPTKESLLLDREEGMVLAIRAALGPRAPARSPIQAAVELLRRELEDVRQEWAGNAQRQPVYRQFVELVEETPSLRAAQGDMWDRLVQVTAEALADRAGVSPYDPEPQIAAAAILGLWRIQYRALWACARPGRSFDEIYEEVTSEVTRAARLLDSGLWAFEVMVQGRGTRDQVKTAAEAAQNAGRQVAAALRQARDAWRQVQRELSQHEHAGIGPPGRTGGDDDAASGPTPRRPGHHGAPNSFHRDMAEWKLAQRELKQQLAQAKREQQRAMRDAMHQATHQQARQRGRGRGPSGEG